MYYKHGDQETLKGYMNFLHIRRANSASSDFNYLPNKRKTIPKNTTAKFPKIHYSLSFHPYLNNKKVLHIGITF